jgi:hypothetical protein
MIQLQKQSGRNLVVSANSQAAYGGCLADANLTRRLQFDASSVMEKTPDYASDQKDVGKGTEFATNGEIVGWSTKQTLKKDADAWYMGWVMAFLFGQSVDSGAGPYRHAYTFPNINATLEPTTVYCEETNDVKYKVPDITIGALTLNIPARGRISTSVDLLGTGRWVPGAMAGGPPALPALAAADYLKGSDMFLNILPAGGGNVLFNGRMRSGTAKLSNQSAPFESVGDGLYAGSVNSGIRKHSLDVQIAAQQADDVNGWFESGTLLNVSLATNPALANQLGLNWPAARVKANKLGNDKDLVIWGLSLDETTCYAQGGNPAVSAYVINGQAAYLIPA